MQLRIANMLGIVEAEMDLSPGRVFAVTGGNASGKSSLAVAAGAVLARQDNPLGAASTQVKLYMHDGAVAGEVALSDAEGSVRWFMPTGDLQQAPGVVFSSSAAVGLEDFISHRSPAALAALWEGLFLPSSEKIAEQLKKRLKPILDEESIKRILKTIKSAEDDPTVAADKGWTIAQSTYVERAKQAKRQWMSITGTEWGVRKGADWLPDRWLAEFDGVTVQDAERDLEEAETAVQAAHVAHAVDASQVDQAREAKRKIPAAERAMAEAETADDEAQAAAAEEIREREDARNALRAADLKVSQARRKLEDTRDGGSHTVTCPACQAKLVLLHGKLAEKPDNSELIAAYQRELDEANEARGPAATAFEAVESVRVKQDAAIGTDRKVREAEAELRALRLVAQDADATVQTEEMVQALDDARAHRDRTQERLKLIQARFRTQELHGNIVQYEQVAKLLAPTGVRADVMAGALKQVNAVMERLSTLTGWPAVEVGNKYGISIGKRRLLRMCADSERLRAQYMLQIAIARCRRDPVVILDEVDTLETEERRKLADLISFLASKDPPTAFVLCGTRLEEEFWQEHAAVFEIEDGVLEAAA